MTLRAEEMRAHTPQFARQRSKREKEELGMDQENQSRREGPKELSGVKGGRGEPPKKIGAVDRQKEGEGEPVKRSQGRKRRPRQNRDQRDQPNKEERVQGDHKGSGKRKNQRDRRGPAPKSGSKGSSVESQIKGANGPRSEAVETLPEANPRGESVVSGETDSRSQSKGRKSISQGVTGS